MLFDRVAELVVGQSGGKGISIKLLRFSFSIEKSAAETPNKSVVRIYNLNLDSRKLVEKPNNVVILKAGYSNEIGPVTLFVGIVTRCLTQRAGVDWETELELEDGALAYRDSKISLAFPPGVKGRDVLSSVASQFNLPVRTIPAEILDKTYASGFSFVGRTREAMTKVSNYLGAEWSIQDQEIQIAKKGSSYKKTAIVLSPDSGMIGSPALETKTLTDKAAAKKGISATDAGVIVRQETNSKGKVKQKYEVQGFKIKSLLQPTSQPGDLVKIQAQGIDAFQRIEKLEHKGDTHGGEWTTELTTRAL